MPAITTLLSALPALHTIQILSCKIAGDFKNAVTYLSLPTVHTLIIPTDANALVRACPNVKHVRCAGGHGSALVGSLKGSECETLDGMIDWVKDRKVTERLVKSVPLLHTLEIRRPVNRGLGILSQNTAPAQWAQVIPSLAGLKQLRVLILTFPRRDEVPSDRASIDAARDVLRNSELGGEKKLIIRRIEAPHYENNPPHDPDKDLDLLLSESTEIFTSE
ncbi:hypothetical protein PHLCEN_2v12771 [Hermanssonia centrifuga]|uniref:Uncharacterized protein n=1 Tax=Hermanssonia centrifuga TaxID=98765 RepID=A0A2R6NGB3_9APHY|nr:hypothetical protein PHLCEN_2v12771 [Hermanssonia centrifuga]